MIYGEHMKRAALLIALVSGMCLASCSKSASSSDSVMQLNGAGSTFVYPIMSKWIGEYSSARTGVRINYQPIGSGRGIGVVSGGTVDFGATDGPMTDGQLADSNVGPIEHIPLVMGADVPGYNIPGLSAELKFTPSILADIFLGKITAWNDPKITKVNPGISLPNTTIFVVHRSDGSGTTYIWTDYLSKVSPEWKQKVGTALSVNWPTGQGAAGNEGVATMIRQNPGAIGYIELTYAERNNLAFGRVQNSSGNFVKASMDSVTAAATSATIPDDFRYSITNASGEGAYPIAGTTWMLIPVHPRDPNRGKMLVDFAEWILTTGQDAAPTLHYARLPDELAARAKNALNRLRASSN